MDWGWSFATCLGRRRAPTVGFPCTDMGRRSPLLPQLLHCCYSPNRCDTSFQVVVFAQPFLIKVNPGIRVPQKTHRIRKGGATPSTRHVEGHHHSTWSCQVEVSDSERHDMFVRAKTCLTTKWRRKCPTRPRFKGSGG